MIQGFSHRVACSVIRYTQTRHLYACPAALQGRAGHLYRETYGVLETQEHPPFIPFYGAHGMIAKCELLRQQNLGVFTPPAVF